MKRTSWKTVLFCGLTLPLSAMGTFARGHANAEGIAVADSRGGGKGDDKRHAGRGARSQAGGAARAQPSRGGNSARSGGRGGAHAPSSSEPRHSEGNRGRQPFINRTPSFSRPDVGHKRGGTTRRPVNARPTTDARFGGHSSVRTLADRFSGVRQRDGRGSQGNVAVGAGSRRSHSNHSRIVNRPFGGHTVEFHNRRFNVGHSSYRPAYYRHSGYHGYWNGNRGLGGGSVFGLSLGSNLGFGGGYGPGWGWGLGSGYQHGGHGYRPFGWGLGGWGLGALIYNSGYLGYSNPYYVSVGSSGYNYAEPIPVSYNASVAVVENDSSSADEVLTNAVAAFQRNDYDRSLDITNNGIARYSDDAVLHEFRALVLFAKRDYQQAAATIHSVLAVGPGWDWTTLSSLYSNVAIYTKQLRALEAFTAANPQDAASRFLLAYHYMSCGHPDAAARHLQQVVALMPNDRVAADMLKMVSPPPGAIAQPPAPLSSAAPTRAAATPVDPTRLVGRWRAARADGSRFNLTLTNDANFNWRFAPKNQAAVEFGGKYTVDGNVLALERQGGGALIGEVTPGSRGKFNFKLVDAPDDDPGLDFSE